MTKQGCGKQLLPGDRAADRWGIVLCETCDAATPAPPLAIWSSGILKIPAKCGGRSKEAIDASGVDANRFSSNRKEK